MARESETGICLKQATNPPPPCQWTDQHPFWCTNSSESVYMDSSESAYWCADISRIQPISVSLNRPIQISNVNISESADHISNIFPMHDQVPIRCPPAWTNFTNRWQITLIQRIWISLS